MDLLYVAQTIFFFSASVVLIIMGIVFMILGYGIWKIQKFLKKIPEELKKSIEVLKQTLSEKISIFGLLSQIFRNKGRNNSRHDKLCEKINEKQL